MTIQKVLQQGAVTLGLQLSVDQLAAFERLATELMAWNKRINLTAITRSEEIAVKHLLDSLTLVPLLTGNERLLDVGSGAGFPAIPLKIVRPGLSIVSIDAVQKKVHFQRHIIRLLGLAGIEAVHGRVESLTASHGAGFDVVTSRAFAALGDFALCAAPLLAPGGRILAMKGREGEAEAAAVGDLFDTLHLKLVDSIRIQLPEGAGERCIIILQKRAQHS